MMTDLAELRKNAEAATPGEWRYDSEIGIVWNVKPLAGGASMQPGLFRIADIRGWGHLSYRPDGEKMQEANGRLLAMANPVTVIELLDEIERLRAAFHGMLALKTEKAEDGSVDWFGVACKCMDISAKAMRVGNYKEST